MFAEYHNLFKVCDNYFKSSVLLSVYWYLLSRILTFTDKRLTAMGCVLPTLIFSRHVSSMPLSTANVRTK